MHGWGIDERRRFAEIAEEAFAEREGQGRVGQRIFWDPESSRIRRELLAFLDVEEEWRRTERCVPWASEKGFGMPPRRREEESLPPVEIPLGDGRTIRLRGAVDRIDMTGTGVLVVIDYKTGRSNLYQRLGEAPWAIYAGAGRKGGPKREALPRLQLPLYAQAARQMTGAGADVIAGYWFVTQAKTSAGCRCGWTTWSKPRRSGRWRASATGSPAVSSPPTRARGATRRTATTATPIGTGQASLRRKSSARPRASR